MTHIRRVVIQNYQSIKRADLRLGEITVVIGPSDMGKSALIRALRDWAYNGSGNKFVTVGADTTRVACALGRKLKVVWEKRTGKKKNVGRYVVADGETGEKIAYEKFGRAVPPEVVDLTKIRPIVVDDLRFNVHVAEQDEAAFLLAKSWTPTMVAKIVGRISGIDALVLANRDLNRKLTEAKGAAKRTRVRVDEFLGALEAFEGLDALEEKVKQAQGVADRLETNERRLEKANRALVRFREARAGLEHSRAHAEALGEALAHVEAAGLEEQLETLRRALRLQERVGTLESKTLASEHRANNALGRLEECGDLLRALSEDEDLQCPLCGLSAHADCRSVLFMQGEALKD